jgi:hypothetical protein
LRGVNCSDGVALFWAVVLLCLGVGCTVAHGWHTLTPRHGKGCQGPFLAVSVVHAYRSSTNNMVCRLTISLFGVVGKQFAHDARRARHNQHALRQRGLTTRVPCLFIRNLARAAPRGLVADERWTFAPSATQERSDAPSACRAAIATATRARRAPSGISPAAQAAGLRRRRLRLLGSSAGKRSRRTQRSSACGTVA